jgi:nitrate reductase gamma subunit
MEVWLQLAKGPLFWVAFTVMVLGLGRHVVLTVYEAIRAYRRAGDKDIPTARVSRETLEWLVPRSRLRNRWLYSATTFLFHVGVILVPLFLAGHIELWRQAVGFGWPALPNTVATTLTLLTIAAALAVLVQRLASRESRALGRFQDYALPFLLMVVFATGFMVMHPAWNPWGRDPVFLIHVLSGDLALLLVPFTKLSHMVLLPLTQLVGELAWHFPQDAGERVGVTLEKESEPI